MSYEFLEGNEAIVRAALRAGCDFFAGYPITPASSILQYMLERVPATGGTAIQAEDEIASMGFCIGAVMAGAKAMTATSGPGLSLYSENIGLAIIGEVPLVIVDIQRQGPATGSATKGADGDVMFARWGTSGGLPIIALCPSTVAEAYSLTYLAFNLAEAYRVPVFVLGNKELGLTRERVDLDAIELPDRVDRRRAAVGQRFVPHGFDRADQVPAMSPMGGEHLVRFTTSSHDESGFLTSDPVALQRMIDHYQQKIAGAGDALSVVDADLDQGADTLVVAYGVTSRAAAVAVREARANGARVSLVSVKSLWPVPERAIAAAAQGARRVVVPEMNMGQYRLEIERIVGRSAEVVGVHKMDGSLLSPQEIRDQGGLP